MQQHLPAGFNVRRPTIDDVALVTTMLQEKERAEHDSVRITEGELRSSWSSPQYDLSKDAWLFIAPDGDLAATLSVGHWTPTRLYTDLTVHPTYVEQELYPYAIGLVLERARELVNIAPTGARVTLNFSCSEKDIQGHQELPQAGFTHIRSNWTMLIEMDGPPPAPGWPKGVALRPYTQTPEMLRAVFEANDEAFQDHWGHVPGLFEPWKNWVTGRPHFDPSLWFIAYEGDEIAGLALCTKFGEEAWVDDLSVRRPWRKCGLGLALLHHAFGAYYQRGEHRVLLNVDSENLTGATRLYVRAGMHAVEQYDTFQFELRPGLELATE